MQNKAQLKIFYIADCHRAHAACSRTATAAHPVSGQPIVTCRLLLGDRCVED